MRSLLHPVPRLKPLRRRPPQHILLGIPRISPERELAAIRALLKPQLRTALEHQIENGEQRLPRDAGRRLRDVVTLARERFGLTIDFHTPPSGEFYVLATLSPQARPAILASALLLSHYFPQLWITVGRLYARNGRFYRRKRGVKLLLRPASNVHLSRPLRSALQQIHSALRRAQRLAAGAGTSSRRNGHGTDAPGNTNRPHRHAQRDGGSDRPSAKAGDAPQADGRHADRLHPAHDRGRYD